METADVHKHTKYACMDGELEALGIRYMPFALSCYGRRHANLDLVLAEIARQVAAGRGSDFSNTATALQALI